MLGLFLLGKAKSPGYIASFESPNKSFESILGIQAMKRLKAPSIRQRLFEITEELTATGRTSSHEVVARIIPELENFPTVERNDVLHMGLCVLAGRLTQTKSDENQLQFDGFSVSRFADLCIIDAQGNKLSGRFNVTKLKVAEVASHSPTLRKRNKATDKESMVALAQKGVEEGLGSLSFGEFHARRKAA